MECTTGVPLAARSQSHSCSTPAVVYIGANGSIHCTNPKLVNLLVDNDRCRDDRPVCQSCRNEATQEGAFVPFKQIVVMTGWHRALLQVARLACVFGQRGSGALGDSQACTKRQFLQEVSPNG